MTEDLDKLFSAFMVLVALFAGFFLGSERRARRDGTRTCPACNAEGVCQTCRGDGVLPLDRERR